MSVKSRIAIGSLASWASIAISLFSQILIIPFFLTNWNVATYGVWILLQGVASLSASLSMGLLTYIGFEFIKRSSCKDEVAKYLSMMLPWCVFLGLFELALVFVVNNFGIFFIYINNAAPELKLDSVTITIIILSFCINNFLSQTLTGALARALVPYGYDPINAWWYTLSSFIQTIVTAIALLMKLEMVSLALLLVFTNACISLSQIVYLTKSLKKTGVIIYIHDLSSGLKEVYKSIGLVISLLLSNFQAQGLRVLMGVGFSSADVATFATIRTVANFVTQAIGTVSNPIRPEFLRSIFEEKEITAKKLSLLVNLLCIHVSAIGLIVLQFIGADIYTIWTKGRVSFEPLTFSFILCSIMVFSLYQRDSMIVRGMNNIRVQFVVNATYTSVILFGTFLSAGRFGISGVAASILIAECINLYILSNSSKKIMQKNIALDTRSADSLSFFTGAGVVLFILLSVFVQYNQIFFMAFTLSLLAMFIFIRKFTPEILEGIAAKFVLIYVGIFKKNG